MSDSLWPHGLQHARLPCCSQSPGVCSNSCPLSQWCHPTISSSVIPFSYCLQYFPAIGFLEDFLELTPKKDVLFIIGDWNAKVWSQEIPGVTGKFGLGAQNEAGQKITELCQENVLISKSSLPTTQEMTLHMSIARLSIPKPGWLYSLQPKMEKLYTVSKNETTSWLWLRSWTSYCEIQTEIE